ncbi:MAG: hypothetical protein PWQ91_913 [Eubacteriales bacterium]|nr:hypothetical protein [Eubacteriales bacterium]MDN5363852.1 hypothetical protein [Eubacteriales bacterium]
MSLFKKGKRAAVVLMVVGVLLAVFAVGTYGFFGGKKDPGMGEYLKIDADRDGFVTKKELLQHKEKVVKEKHAKAKELARKGERKENLVTITFIRPLPLTEFDAFLRQKPIKLLAFEYRGIDGKGVRWTGHYRTDRGNGFRPDLEELRPQPAEADFRLVGVIHAIGFVPASKLSELQGDSRIFLVDNSADEIFVANPKNKHIPGFFWDLENFGLAQIDYQFSDGPDEDVRKKLLQ